MCCVMASLLTLKTFLRNNNNGHTTSLRTNYADRMSQLRFEQPGYYVPKALCSQTGSNVRPRLDRRPQHYRMSGTRPPGNDISGAGYSSSTQISPDIRLLCRIGTHRQQVGMVDFQERQDTMKKPLLLVHGVCEAVFRTNKKCRCQIWCIKRLSAMGV